MVHGPEIVVPSSLVKGLARQTTIACDWFPSHSLKPLVIHELGSPPCVKV